MMGVFRPDANLAVLLDGGYGFSESTELNAATQKGISVLDRAAQGGFAGHVALLLAHRADPEIRRKDNTFRTSRIQLLTNNIETCSTI